MKRYLTLFLLVLLGLSEAFPQVNGTGFIGNGYYRIKNKGTDRFIYVTDNKDYYDMTLDKEDFQAIQLWKDAGKACTDPASVLYMEYKYSDNNNDRYDLKAQGTGIYMLTGYYITAYKKSDGCYEVYASGHGVTKYLSDNETSTAQQGMMGTGGKLNYRKWVVDKIDPNHATNYIGIKPTIELNGKFYQPYYVGFPFKACSPDMHIYYIHKIDGNKAYMREIEGDIPASTPVIIECASADPSKNRIEPLISTSVKVSGNKLSGVYFCNGKRPKESVDAYKKFDAATMRVFSVANGGLVLTNNAPERLNEIKATDFVNLTGYIKVKCIPANSSYFIANNSTPAVLEILIDSGSGVTGDINDDGKVDIADAVTALNIMATGGYDKAADVNNDKKVDIADFVTILNIMAQQSDEGVKGDLNNDKKVDIADAVTLLNIMASGEYKKVADVNNDKKVDIADFVSILNIMAQH